MIKKILILFCYILLVHSKGNSQEIESLRKQMVEITNGKQAVVGVAINGMAITDSLSLNGARHFPMQSVFKFPIALTVLSEVDKGNLSLNQKIEINKDDLLPGLWSPIRQKYPEGTSLTLGEIIKYSVALSDNVGCDVLLRLLGEPKVVEDYFSGLGFMNIAVKINEETMQGNWHKQFLNWTTPKEANDILLTFYKNEKKLLSKESHDFIWGIMKGTTTGKNSIRGNCL